MAAISLLVSIWNVRRDRPVVKAKAHALLHPETDEYYAVTVSAVNAGRRPIVLGYLWGRYSNGRIGGYAIPLERGKLIEYAIFEYSIAKYDGMMVDISDGTYEEGELRDLFIEDTTGKRYEIEGAKTAIHKVWKSKHPLGKN